MQTCFEFERTDDLGSADRLQVGRIATRPTTASTKFQVMCQSHNSNNKYKHLNVGSLNVRGCREHYQKQIVANDAMNYDLDILGISETHIKGDGLEEIRALQSLLDMHNNSNIHRTVPDSSG